MLLAVSGACQAGSPVIVGAELVRSGERWRADVTVRHPDTGWEHYADAWRIVGPDGQVLGTRTLYHPHVDEQPFTRSLTRISIPAGTDVVEVQAHDSVHGWGASVRVQVPD